MRFPVSPDFDFDDRAIADAKIRFRVWIVAAILAYIFLYLCFRESGPLTWLIKLIFIGGVIFELYLIKKLHPKIRPVAPQLPPPKIQPAPTSFEPVERRMNIGFSEETIKRALPLFRQRFEIFDDISQLNKIPSRVNYLPKIQENRFETLKQTERENAAYQSSPTQAERTIFESLPVEWPKQWSNLKAQNDIRSLSPYYRETNVPLARETSRITERLSVKQPETFGTSLSKQALIQPNRSATPVKTIKRADSKVSVSKAKQSVFSKFNLRRDYIPEYETISASEQALNSSLIALNVNLEKFYIWAFSNIQVWLAYDFIPELLERNFVR